MVTRGNVAIYCYNALTAKTWDVTSSEDGKLTSSSRETESILAKYFSDFVNEKGDMKLVEDVKVVATPVNDINLGSNQVQLKEVADTEYEGTTLVSFIEAEKAGKNKEEKTYAKGDDVVAYIPSEVSSEIASFQGKLVDVIFGRDNKVAYIVVTDDAQSALTVTAWDATDKEIELDGEVYEVNEDATISLFGSYVLATKYNTTDNNSTSIQEITRLFRTLGIINQAKKFDRTVNASIVLDEDGDIKSIDFVASDNFDGTVNLIPVGKFTPVRTDSSEHTIADQNANKDALVAVGLQEVVVEKISNNTIYTVGRSADSLLNAKRIKDLEDKDIRVIKNGEIVDIDAIEEGNVLTVVVNAGNVETIYVSETVITGEVEAIKNDALTIDSTAYTTTESIIGELNGELEDAKTMNTITNGLKAFFEEDVTVYLNFLGEVSAIVAETEATDATLGLIVRDAVSRIDDNDDDYLSVRILTKDGSKSTYKIYAKDEDFSPAASSYKAGTMVIFSANADKKITVYSGSTASKNRTEGIEILNSTLIDTLANNAVEFDLDGSKVKLVKLADADGLYIDYDKQTLKVGNNTATPAYRFSTSSVLYNKYTDDTNSSNNLHEIAKGWSSICAPATEDTEKDQVATILSNTSYMIVDNARVKYCVFDAAKNTYKSTTAEYAVLVDVNYRNNDDDVGADFATLFVNGEEVEYELNTSDDYSKLVEGDFVKYTLSDGKVKTISRVIATSTLADIAATDKVNDDTRVDANAKVLVTGVQPAINTAVKASLAIKDVDEGYVYFTDKVPEGSGYAQALNYMVIDEDGYIVYDLREGSWTMFTGDIKDIEGLYVVGLTDDTDNTDVDILVIVE